MTAENFCYWLQGFIEMTDAGLRRPTAVGQPEQGFPHLNGEQVGEIRKHLALVMTNVTKTTIAVEGPDVLRTVGDGVKEFMDRHSEILRRQESNFPRPPEIYCNTTPRPLSEGPQC